MLLEKYKTMKTRKKNDAVIITAFFNYDFGIRIKYLENYLIKIGYKVTIISSNFDHRNKKYFFLKKRNLNLVHVFSYQKNISFLRIISHYDFSRKVFQLCYKLKPDLIYAITPPNFLFYYLNKYKKRHNNIQMVFEIEDLWPESIPLNYHLKNICKPIFNVWAKIRDKNLKRVDKIIFECEHFKNYLYNKIPSTTLCSTIYLGKDDTFSGNFEIEFENKLNYLYIGSINNLIDLKLIVKIMKISQKKLESVLHIIGGGENTSKLIKMCINNKINVKYYGYIFNEKVKQDILKKCHFAFNIMKKNVFVGLTMKSLEYFHYAIPIINNIPGDTFEIVKKYRCGINITSQKNIVEDISNLINDLNTIKIKEFKKKSRLVYEEYFHPNKMEYKLNNIFNQ